MNGLVLYRSYYGNTRQVAEAMIEQIKLLGHNFSIQDMRIKAPNLRNVDFILIGAPTRMGRVTHKALGILKKMRKEGYSKIPIAVFDTCGQKPANHVEEVKAKKWLYPGASGIMHAMASRLGLNVFANTLRCEVTGLKGPLAPDAKGKAAAFVRDFIFWIEGKPTAETPS